jgi:hypothetical protein
VANDLEAALNWYDGKSAEVGDRFRQAVESGFDAIEANPSVCPFAWTDLHVRFYRLRRFPYLILFQQRPTLVFVVGVVHASRDLRKLRVRLDSP